MSIANPPSSPSSSKAGQSSFADVEKLLEMAERMERESEDLDERIFRIRLRIQMTRGFVVIFGFVSAFVFFWIGIGRFSGASLGSLESLFTIFFTVGMIFGCFAFFLTFGSSQVFRKLSAKREIDRRALSEIVSLLREIEHAAALKTGATALERATFRIRIARFDIG